MFIVVSSKSVTVAQMEATIRDIPGTRVSQTVGYLQGESFGVAYGCSSNT